MIDLHFSIQYPQNSSDDQATSDINSVGFWAVPPEFNSVQQASIQSKSVTNLLYRPTNSLCNLWG